MTKLDYAKRSEIDPARATRESIGKEWIGPSKAPKKKKGKKVPKSFSVLSRREKVQAPTSSHVKAEKTQTKLVSLESRLTEMLKQVDQLERRLAALRNELASARKG